jgi:hypothetical protein
MRFMLTAALIASVYLAGCATRDEVTAAQPQPAASTRAASIAATAPDVHDIATRYASLKLMTKQPIAVSPGLSTLCKSAAVPDVAAQYGPHANGTVRIFMNDLAAGAFAQPGTFPVGSVIVKEKQPSKFGVGGMIKRPPGYDSDHGDWEYFYFEDPAKLDSGKLTSCAQCHERAAKTDYVFGEWAGRGGTK